jgi:hypothetical protein
MNAIAKLREDVAFRQANDQQASAEREQLEETQQQFTATNLGYNSDRQAYELRKPGGAIVFATNFSATGADGTGDTVQLSQLQGRSIFRGRP